MSLRKASCGAILCGMVGCIAHPDVVAVRREPTIAAGGAEATAGSRTAGDLTMAGTTTSSGTGGIAGATTGSTGGETAGGSAGTTSGADGGTSLPQALPLTGDLDTHDSCVIEAEGRYTLFYTGFGIQCKTSNDLLDWREGSRVFAETPAWIGELVPDATVLWAPDVSFVDGVYHLYYAASTFGSGRSCIGHAVSRSLFDGWEDRGPVICSDLGGEDIDDWDAIDPSTITASDGTRWMALGSFGSGIKLIQLEATGAWADDTMHSLAARPPETPAVQAPFLLYRAPYYYLFVSFDFCCRGVSSTYNIRVGRSERVLGPYVDRDEVPMLEGGGTLVLEGNDRWRGAGANTILTAQGRDYNVYHSYDANDAGRATLRISEVEWDEEGWPVVGGP